MGSVSVVMFMEFFLNICVQVYDIVVGKEQFLLLIIMNNNYSCLLFEVDLDIKVEIFNSKNYRSQVVVLDKIWLQGCYKVVFIVLKFGEYRVLVKIMGMFLELEGYVFKVKCIDDIGFESSLVYFSKYYRVYVLINF